MARIVGSLASTRRTFESLDHREEVEARRFQRRLVAGARDDGLIAAVSYDIFANYLLQFCVGSLRLAAAGHYSMSLIMDNRR